MNTITANLPLEIKSMESDGDGERTLEGLLACYSSADYGGHIIAPGAFTSELGYFITNGVLRDEHEVTTGKVLDAKEVSQGLWFKARVSKTDDGNNQWTLLKDDVYKFLSVGMRPMAYEWLEGLEETQGFWESVGYTATDQDIAILNRFYAMQLVRKARPYEGSTTFAPANPNTAITAVKSANGAGPKGRTFDGHALTVLDAVEDFVNRAERLREKRADDGRTLSVKHKARFKALHAQLLKLLAGFDGDSGTAELDAPVKGDGSELYDAFLALNAAQLGVDVPFDLEK